MNLNNKYYLQQSHRKSFSIRVQSTMRTDYEAMCVVRNIGVSSLGRLYVEEQLTAMVEGKELELFSSTYDKPPFGENIYFKLSETAQNDFNLFVAKIGCNEAVLFRTLIAIGLSADIKQLENVK